MGVSLVLLEFGHKPKYWIDFNFDLLLVREENVVWAARMYVQTFVLIHPVDVEIFHIIQGNYPIAVRIFQSEPKWWTDDGHCIPRAMVGW